jgi:DNA-binding NarL/FixJ family response regulator
VQSTFEGGRSKRVLIVEDEPVFATYLQRTLTSHCAPRLAVTLREARREIEDAGWAGFLIDVQLPDGQGTDLLAAIREAHAQEPVVIMTGGDLAPPSREALLHRAMFVAKPLPIEWLATFGEWLQGSFDGDDQDGSIRPGDLGARLIELGLSEREREVFSELAKGATADKVAQRLGISASTVRSHCYRVYARLGAGSLTEVLALANGWQG